MRGLYNIIEGQDILTLSEEKMTPLVEGILYPNDYILIVAEEKIGKTVFGQQLTCNMSTAMPFLNTFNIPSPLKTWYFFTEVKADEMKDRFIRINHAMPINVNKIKLIPTTFWFNTTEGMGCLTEIIEKYKKEDYPDVIIIDALYKAIKGSIKDDNVVNHFHHIINVLMNKLDCAAIVIHHMTKPQRSQHDGNFYTRSDKDTFGSAFLLAGVDHCLWIEKWKNNGKEYPLDRLLRCDTQRSGNIIESIRIRMLQPDPLQFITVDKHEEGCERVITILKAHKELNSPALMSKSKLGRSIFYEVIRELKNQGRIVVRKEGRIVLFRLS